MDSGGQAGPGGQGRKHGWQVSVAALAWVLVLIIDFICLDSRVFWATKANNSNISKVMVSPVLAVIGAQQLLQLLVQGRCGRPVAQKAPNILVVGIGELASAFAVTGAIEINQCPVVMLPEDIAALHITVLDTARPQGLEQ